MGVYRLGYYPHNVHFVMASALMAGDGPSGISAAEKLRGLVPDQAALAIPGAHPVKAAPYFAHAMFSPPDVILVLPDPGMAIPYVKAMWHYARGIAYVARRDLSAATAEAGAIPFSEIGEGEADRVRWRTSAASFPAEKDRLDANSLRERAFLSPPFVRWGSGVTF